MWGSNIMRRIFSVLWISFLVPLHFVRASECPCAGNYICNPIKACNFAELVQSLASAITAIGIPLVAVFLVWSGFLFVVAQGNEEKLKRAKQTLYWAVIGGAIVIGAYAIATAIVNFARNL